jgi:hypothetical protein
MGYTAVKSEVHFRAHPYIAVMSDVYFRKENNLFHEMYYT